METAVRELPAPKYGLTRKYSIYLSVAVSSMVVLGRLLKLSQ